MNLTPPRSARRAGLVLTVAVLALGQLTGCARRELRTAVELAEFVPHQRDNVTTEVISASDELGTQLATHGWRVERGRKGGAAALVMRRDRARLWFFSADGATTGVEVRAGLAAGGARRGRRVLYRLNGHNESQFTLQPGSDVHRLAFDAGSVRPGWNVLELRLRRVPDDADTAEVRLRGARFLHRDRRTDPRARVRRMEVADGVLRMPAGAVLDAVFEVPPAGRFLGRLTAETPAGRSIEVALELTLASAEEITLARRSLTSGESVTVEHDLEPWQGDLVRLRTVVAGDPRATAIWSAARIATTAEATLSPFERLILPASPTRGRDLGRPDVFLILLDAARADAFSPWGGPYPTPALDALAAVGTRFVRALAPSSWTGQSMPAIFTGFYPDTIGVRKWGDPLTTEVPTLAELFDRAGYHTVLWSQHPLYSRGPTLSRGFREATFAGTDDLTRLPTIDELTAEGAPSFAFIHLLPPHGPYSPPPPFRGSYTSGYEGKIPEGLGILNRYHKRRDPKTLSAADRKYVRDRYQENVAFADHLVGRLIANLESAGRYQEALIAVISDHGEAFLEHGRFLHSRRIYQEFVHVPFVVKWPGSIRGHRPQIEESVSLVDLAPTLASGLRLAGAERGFQGVDLLPAVFDGIGSERALYAITRGDGDSFRAPKRWIRWERDGWSLVWGQLDDRTELYDLRADPSEQRDLAAEHPIRALQLLQELRRQHFFNQTLLGLSEEEAVELDPELARELKALGYL